MAPWHFHFAGLLCGKVCLGENIPEGPACRGSICSPTQSTYGLYPSTAWCFQERSSSSSITSQTQESSGYPPDGHPCLPGIYGPSQRGIRFIKKSKDCKLEPKQENEANAGLARNVKPCPLLWASAHSCLSTYLSTLAITESTSTLLTTQPFPAKWTLPHQRGLQIFPRVALMVPHQCQPFPLPPCPVSLKNKTKK